MIEELKTILLELIRDVKSRKFLLSLVGVALPVVYVVLIVEGILSLEWIYVALIGLAELSVVAFMVIEGIADIKSR